MKYAIILSISFFRVTTFHNFFFSADSLQPKSVNITIFHISARFSCSFLQDKITNVGEFCYFNVQYFSYHYIIMIEGESADLSELEEEQERLNE